MAMLKTVLTTEYLGVPPEIRRVFHLPYRQYLIAQILLFLLSTKQGGFHLQKGKSKAPSHSKAPYSPGSVLRRSFFTLAAGVVLMPKAYAASTTTDIWTKASEIMQDVNTQILSISTIAAVVTAAVALLLMNFSRSGRTVDESRAWLKRIIITWAILNGLGFIMAYVAPFFHGGQWTPTTP